MTKIISNVTSLIALKLNKEYKETKTELDKLERTILELEIHLANYQKTRDYLEKKLIKIELDIVDSIFEKK